MRTCSFAVCGFRECGSQTDVFPGKGYEQEQELLWALEQQRYQENAWEVKEDKKPFWIFGNSLLLAAAVMVCVLSHPAVGVLALNVYFPCLGIAFLLLTVLIYLIIKRHRGNRLSAFLYKNTGPAGTENFLPARCM